MQAIVGFAAFAFAPNASAAAASENARIDATIREAFGTGDIHAVIVHATADGRTVIKKAYGQSRPASRRR